MKRLLKWVVLVVVVAALGVFLAFLYYIPPFLTTPPEEFQKAMKEAPPTGDDIADAATRAIAARGRYIVMTVGCIGCHVGNGLMGPDLTKYLAGGGLKSLHREGTYVSANLTPDSETGLARRTDEEVKRVLRSGTFLDGHVTPHTAMPWANLSNLSEEDRHAVVVYLRHLPTVRRLIPGPVPGDAVDVPGALQTEYASKNYYVDSTNK
jgi:mono/diheme cytochrome c family protein